MKSRIPLLLISLIAGYLSAPVSAEVYKWVDDKGVTQYSDNPPSGKKSQKVVTLDESASPSGGTDSKDPLATIHQQEIEFNKRRIAREVKECAALAREIVDNQDRAFHVQLIAKYNAMCPNRAFECTTVRSNPNANKCVPARFTDGSIIRNTTKAQ